MTENDMPRREDGKAKRPRRTFTKERQEGERQYHQSVDGESQAGPYRASGVRSYSDPRGERPNRYIRPAAQEGGRGNYSRDKEGYAPRKKFGSHPGGATGEGQDRGNGFKKKPYGAKPAAAGRKAAPKGKHPLKAKKKKEVVIPETARPNPANVGLTRLNKYLSTAGVCSRREADKLISAGAVTVNGEVITTMGFMVKPTDVVMYAGQQLQQEKKRYVLLNKPKGFITTMDDPEGRHTVMELVQGQYKERICPVGRLDRNTTGLLLFTNDGDLSKKLTHPSTGIYKIYHVELDKPLTAQDVQQLRDGMELEDGYIKVDDIQYVGDGSDKRIVGVAIHSGRNRIVRRLFDALGYEVMKLDRVVFAGLTKKDLPRGRHRDLTEKEVAFLKMI